MADDQPPTLQPVDRPLDLIPVGLKEAALDSPTFRASTHHFAEQVEQVEKWLEGLVKAGNRLAHDVNLLENTINSWLQQTVPPNQVTEAVIDHDYTVLATRRYTDAAREFWQASFKSMKKNERNMLEPIKGFINRDLRSFKDARRNLDSAQRHFDGLLSRYASQPRAKEASSLREDAFQLHEARKAYVKASMDFCVQGPTLRASLDRLMVRVFADQWRELKLAKDSTNAAFQKAGTDMERIRGWGREMENSERAFSRELQAARQTIEISVEHTMRPSRELDDYADRVTAPFLGSSVSGSKRAEKQGWLFLKTVTGKPARTVYTRRWFYVKNGIFAWLVQGSKSGGVEESEKIGLLLCSIRPALQEERRFCFELKTKDTTIILQAESQSDLDHWIDAFNLAKQKALESPSSTETSLDPIVADAAFAISPPVAEFAAKGDAHLLHSGEEPTLSLAVPDTAAQALAARSSVDVASPRRVFSENERDGNRIMQKLDLHRKATPSAGFNPSGGIASLISSSHNALPLGPMSSPAFTPNTADAIPRFNNQPTTTSLAPATLANPPSPTNLSKTAVVVSGERGITFGQSDGSGMPGSIMANLWGSEKWGTVNRLERDGQRVTRPMVPSPATPVLPEVSQRTADDLGIMHGSGDPQKASSALSPPRANHRRILSGTPEKQTASATPWNDGFPHSYPLPLRVQDAQFRTFFPEVSMSEKLVLAFRATWNPNDEQEFPGRVYLTEREVFFYSNHLGFVLVSGVSMETITEITAAPGKDCDFLFMHLKDSSRPNDLRRVTIKTFLEPLNMLQKRLNYLVQNANAEKPASLDEVMKALIAMERVEPAGSGDNDSWDMLASSGDEDRLRQPKHREHDIKPSLRIDGNVYGGPIGKTGREVTRFRLPAQPVVYAPPNSGKPVAVKDFATSAKALFHVLFGDRSAIFQQSYRNYGATEITQSPWNHMAEAHSRRTLNSTFDFGKLVDTQTIDVQNDHLCYVVTSSQVPINYPLSDRFFLMTKYVITHSAKSQCSFAIYSRIIWTHDAPLSRIKRLIERRVSTHLNYDAQSLMGLAMDQVVKLGGRSKTSKAIHIFGHIGQVTQPIHLAAADLPPQAPGVSRRELRSYTIVALYWREFLIVMLKIVSALFDVVDAVTKGIMSVVSTHSVLVLLLALSATYNTWNTYRDGLGWWRERAAGRYMAELGVRSDHTIARAIYVRDLHELLDQGANSTTLLGVGKPTSSPSSSSSRASCRKAFDHVLVAQSTPGGLAAASSSGMSPRTERRLRGTRKTLAGYRHDLLVALRVVNSVEREVVGAAWRDWLGEETVRCERMAGLVGEEQRDKKSNDEGSGRWAKVKEGLGAYCDGCREELAVLGGSGEGTRL